MTLSNYPPGVSGNEPQIAGYDEVYIARICDVCDFDEYVDAVYDTGLLWWTCPECGTEHEDVFEWEDDEYDPDHL